jgi:hypothetical protein
MACASRARKPASPSISQITGIFTPQRASISWSESKKRSFSRRASERPTVGLPGAHHSHQIEVLVLHPAPL